MSFQAYLDNIKAKTGKTPEDFKKLADKKGLLDPLAKAGEIIAWLKKDFELGHGHAMAIYTVFTGRKNEDAKKQDVAALYFTSSKAIWKPDFDSLISSLKKTHKDIRLGQSRSYISLLRGENKFAIVQATANRMDIGIKLKGEPFTDRFGEAGSWNNMITHRVKISHSKDINKELIKWLEEAYKKAG